MKVDIKDKPLSVFLSAADDTTKRLLATSTVGVRLVQEVDDLIRLRLWGEDVQLGPVPGMLALNSYYSFLGAVRVALSGQLAAVFPLIRHSLECACYTYLMTERPELSAVWSNRHKGGDELKSCRKAFGSAVADVANSIKSRHEQLGSLIDDLYQASIDFGARPNAKSVISHIFLKELEEGTEVSLACLFGENDIRCQQGLIACAENGIASTFITALAAKNHSLVDVNYTSLAAIYARVQAAIAELESGYQRSLS
jgi:hypothetical protein